MSYNYKLINNSSCGTLIEYDGNNHKSWSSPCLCNNGFQYTGNNSPYKNQLFYIKKETNGRFCLYSATRELIGGQYVWKTVGSVLISSN